MNNTFEIKDFLEVKSAGGASFSPDGNQVAYLSNATGTSQIFLVAAQGGEPVQLTSYDDAVSFVLFSPTKNVLIFGKSEGGNEQTQLYLLDLTSRQVTSLTAEPKFRHDFGGWSPDGDRICFASNKRNGKDFDVYVMDVSTLEKHCIFVEGEWSAADGFSPQGTYVVVRKKHANTNTDLYLCNLITGAVDHITPHEGQVYYAAPRWLPDESAFFLVTDQDREFKGLARYSLIEKKFEDVFTPGFDVEGTAIDTTGTNIAICTNEAGYERAAIYDALTLEPLSCRLPAGNVYRTRFSQDGHFLAFSLGDSCHTSDVWILSLETGEARQLTHSHQGVPPDAMVEPELFHFASFDGLSIPAFVYRPKGIKDGTKVPVIINIHGGPEGQYQPTYQPVMQYFVQHGYAVIAPNVRGSSGYGKSYMALDDVEKRLDSVKDIVALREHIATIPDLDATKIALIGGSYGGYMVLACMTFYPKLWVAGVDVVGIVNFITFLENTAGYRRALREAEYGSLENDRAVLEKISPIHSIENIEAPLLVIHGANDPRVPLSEAEQVVSRLKAAGRRVELLVYPDEGHGIHKLKNKLDAYPKVADFLQNIFESAQK